MSQLPERLETYLCSFVTQSTKYAFEVEGGAPGDLLATTLLLWAKTAGTENIRCATVNAICGLITANEGARDKISGQNGMQIVADVLHRSKTENSIGACAQTLTALANLSRNRRVLCCHRYAVTDLVQACEKRSEVTSRKCVACLKEIALEYSCHQVLLRCSALEATSVFLRKRPADAASKLLLIFWHNLSCTKSSWVRFGPHLDILCVYLNHSAAAMQSLTLCILCNVLLNPENCEHFGRQTVFKAVMDRLSPLAALGVATKACFTFQNALQFSANCRRNFGEQGGVSLMMKLVLLYEENDIRESALTVALMAIQETPTERHHALSSITQLLEILSYDLTSYGVVVRILNALAFLAKTDEVTRQKIMAVNAIAIVVQLFAIPEKLGDIVVLKHQKDGDRLLALKMATAFIALLSRSKKALARLVSQGGLAMIISILAEHCISALPESIVVNSSMFLANLSTDREGLKDVVATCGIPVILKSAVVSATAICASHKESDSPHRMRKFPALKGLPNSPQAAITAPDNKSQDTSKCRENIEPALQVEAANSIETAHASAPVTSINLEGSNIGATSPSEHLEPAVIPGVSAGEHSTSNASAPILPPTNLDTAADVLVPMSSTEFSDPVDTKSWLANVGMPVAISMMKSVIKACVSKFESSESVAELPQQAAMARDLSGDLVDEPVPPSAQIMVETAKVSGFTSTEVALDAGVALASETLQKDAVQLPLSDLNSNDAASVLEVTQDDDQMSTVAEEPESDALANDDIDWAKNVDQEDVWGKNKCCHSPENVF